MKKLPGLRFSFVLAILCSSLVLKGMEQNGNNISLNELSKVNAPVERSTNKRRKKKKNSKATQFHSKITISSKDLNKAIDEVDLVKEFFNTKSPFNRIQKLSLFADLLLVQKALIDFLKTIAINVERILETSFCDRLPFQGDKNYDETIVGLANPRLSEIYEFVEEEIYEIYDLIEKNAPTDSTYDKILPIYLFYLNLINETNNTDDLKIKANLLIAKATKYFIEHSFNLINFFEFDFICSNLLISLGAHAKKQASESEGPEFAIEMCKAVENCKKIYTIVNEFLEKNGLSDYTSRLIPHLKKILNKTLKIERIYKSISLNCSKIHKPRRQMAFVLREINKIIEEYQAAQDMYNKLYLKTMIASKDIENTYLNTLAKVKDTERIRSYFNSIRKITLLSSNDYVTEKPANLYAKLKIKNCTCSICAKEKITINQEEDTDFIGDLIPYHQQFQKKQSLKPKKKKKGRHRANGRKTVNYDEQPQEIKKSSKQQDLLKFPNYDQRIWRWFEDEFIQEAQPSVSSIRYHTYDLLADTFIRKYGILKTHINNTTGTQDKLYCLPGEIKDKASGKKFIVLFGICFGQDDICYHRGFNRFNSDQIISLDEFEFKFEDEDKLKSDTLKNMHIKSKSTLFNNKSYKENNFCIIIDDKTNNIVITLFKPKVCFQNN